MQFYKTGQYVVFIKTRTEYASKGGIELAVHKVELLLAILVLGLWLAILLCVLRLVVLSTKLLGVLLLGHSVGYERERHNGTQTSTTYKNKMSSEGKEIK